MTPNRLIAAALVVAGVSVLQARQGQTGAAAVSGELRQWHKVTLTLDGPQADESGKDVNPFLDYRMTVTFAHESGAPVYNVPGYFAADGNAATTSATAGNKWRAHFSPDKTGRWDWRVAFVSGKGSAVDAAAAAGAQPVAPFDGMRGAIQIAASNKSAPDFRALGRLEYVGGHYLRFAGTGEYFLKAGSDSPETLLAYADFDGTTAVEAGGAAQDVRAAREGLDARRSVLEGRQGQGAHRRAELSRVQEGQRDFVPALQRRRRRRQRLAVCRQGRQVPLRRLEAGPVADRLRSRAAKGPVPPLQARRRPRTTTTCAAAAAPAAPRLP